MSMQRKAYSRSQRSRFQDYFGIDIQIFWDGLTGFDVVKFDTEVIKSRDGESCRDAIEKTYGTDAAQLIESLIDADIKRMRMEYGKRSN